MFQVFQKMLSNGWRSPSSKAFTKCYLGAGHLQVQMLLQNGIAWSEICKALLQTKNLLKKKNITISLHKTTAISMDFYLVV